MATKKKTSTRKKTTGKPRKTSRKQSHKRSSSVDFALKNEVLLLVILVFSVILFITNLGKGGVVGNALSYFFFGVYGLISYAFPVVLFLLSALIISNMSAEGKSSNSGRAFMKIVAFILFFIFICVFAQLVYESDSSTALKKVFTECATNKVGGGVLGGSIAYGLSKAFGLVGAYIIDFAILVFSLVMITEKSLFKGLSNGSRRLLDSDRPRPERKRERKERTKPTRRELREASLRERVEALDEDQEVTKPVRRSDKKVSGVTLDTKLEPEDKKASDRISEIDVKDAFPMDDMADEITRKQSDDFWENLPEPEIRISGQSEEQKVKRPRKPRQTKEEVTAGIDDIQNAIDQSESDKEQMPSYIFPPVDLLKPGDPNQMGDSREHLQEMSTKLQMTLQTFGVNARVTNVICGPSVTQYEIQPEMGVKVSKILNLADDIKLNLAVPDIRIEAPIPGKAAIGIEVPNKENVMVSFRDLIESREFQDNQSKISFCAGKDIAGNVIVADIAKMPHLLIAGATGSGKSVCINTIIMSILYKADPEEVKLIMIDPKVVELSVYNSIPHLLIPVVTDPKKAAGALHWAVAEMTDRYNKFAEYGVRDIKGYNRKVASIEEVSGEDKPKKMTQIVVIVDELADLMMVASQDVEDAICRLAQLARAAGIHLIIATQRPSVNVITGLIKANMPSRIAFSVTSGVDSRTILDSNGAEKLLGKGDMLFYPQGYAKPLRVQGAFVSDKEVADVVDYIVEQNGQVSYNSDIEEKVKASEVSMGGGSGFTVSPDDRDSYFMEVARFIIEKEKGSIGMLQRNFRIGYNRAARIMDQLEEAGIVGPEEGTKPRRVLITLEQFESMDEI